MKKPVIAITMGDPGGVGPEVTLKALRDFREKARIILVGNKIVFDQANRLLRNRVSFAVLNSMAHFSNTAGEVSLLEVSGSNIGFIKAKISRSNGEMAYRALKKGVALARSGLVSALVTAPLSKSAVRLSNRRFQDQTEFIRKASRSRKYAMSFIAGRQCVTLVTTHVPLNGIARILKRKDIVEKTILTVEFLRKVGHIRKPKVVVLGLNPHAGESGMLGSEEEKIIKPAVRDLKNRGIDVSGPAPADSVFYAWDQGKFDAVIAMYHDQGLGPFKMRHFHDGVHVTLGLPFIRTSPDHGTAFDIAYLGKASALAMQEAIRSAICFAKLR